MAAAKRPGAPGGNDRLLGYAGADVLIGDEGADLLNGGAGNDMLSGGSGNDRLLGGNGLDWLAGGAGNDRLEGNLGRDTLAGGGGADRFIYNALSDSGPLPGGRDAILDFSAAQGDRIDLSRIDAVAGTLATDDAFTFIGNKAFTPGVAGQLRYEPAPGGFRVFADVNGDASADFSLLLSGAVPPAKADFIL